MFKKIVIVLLVLLVVFLGLVAIQPGEFHYERSAVVSAAPAEVFPYINELRKWDDWSPWAKLDPHAENSFDGPEAGVGSVFRWKGNQEVGEGSMTILESVPNEKVRIRLQFIKPFEDVAETQFDLRPEGNGTHVTWSMEGKNNFVGRVMCLLMNMEKMIGEKFDQGLASMKSVVEAASDKAKAAQP